MSKRSSRPTKAAKEHLERIKKKQKLTPLGDSIVQVRSDGSRVLKTMAPSTPSSSHVRISVATSSPLPLPTGASPPPSPDTGTPETPPENKDNNSKPSQSTQALQELVAILPELTNLLLMHEANVEANEECSCGRGKCLVSCQDCLFYETSCKHCFIDRHRCMPLHWARVWDLKCGFYRRHDISTLRDDYAIQLGHTSGTCRNPQKPVKFIITHSNGVHGTRVSFCECFGCGNRVHQLMRAKLFPGSAAEPISAFSFAVLKEYDIHSLQAKIGGYDYVFSLRRLSDNVFTHLINDPYQTFLRIARLWRYLESRLRFGQVHGIDRLFPHRPPGSLMVYCPACMDPGVNIFGKWWTCPVWLRHLIQMRITIDGNHQVSQFWKNTDPHDVALAMEYAAHCNHVKVIANQGRIQNQNCAKTGAVNTQCDHVFVMATADMQNGERYANVDASTHQAFKMYGYGDGKTENHRHCVPCRDSYDANCSYWTYKGKRFAASTYLSDQKEFVVKFEHGIPDLHIKGHKDDCMVVFGTPYQCREQGDSKRGNGLLWTIGAASDLLAGVEPGEDLPVGLDEDLVPVSLVTPTRMTQRISAPTGPRAKTDKTTMTTELTENIVGLDREDEEALAAADMEDAVPYDEGPTSAREKRNKKKEKKYRKDSWLWSKGTRNMTADQMMEWETEGDRVQWFRAEAEMYRWMEQFEIKHAEFARVISHFRTMSSTWNSLAESHESPGHTAYAKRHAMMYMDLAEDAELRFKRVGHPEFVVLAEDVLLHE
ncbi:hypothetical protein K435DRAFT_859998 [Dendrothele bispora CBS 962.96]|uniref:CxC2-like cysteine cluster KDZ transposase-associated domain-containing protein n=1 Tax=Dendrothele bispora (strain CBS 962.96) TaxID=1314807 RepID=A0A4S8M088_DENBC|nr:hypothetical protein K435DRAFT_859998 [Dendrothele bispora CBS 962.96]